jgi:hypothetical protein
LPFSIDGIFFPNAICNQQRHKKIVWLKEESQKNYWNLIADIV